MAEWVRILDRSEHQEGLVHAVAHGEYRQRPLAFFGALIFDLGRRLDGPPRHQQSIVTPELEDPDQLEQLLIDALAEQMGNLSAKNKGK